MKLKTLVIVSLSIIPIVAFANNADNKPFAGLFAGLGLGYKSTHAKIDIPDFANDNVNKSGLAEQAFVGYNYAIDTNWLVGAQFSFTNNNVKVEDTVDSVTITGKMNHAYGLDGLLGYTFNQSIMVFAGLGFSVGDLKKSAHGATDTDTFGGWTGLVGAQQALVDSLSLQETISYTDYKSKNIHITDPKIYVKPSDYTSMVSLVYTFNM